MAASRQRGFTLIELVVVITILGILAAFAVPKFIQLDTTARLATLNALGGTVRSASALARGMAMASGATNVATGQTVTMEGSTVTLAYLYPTGDAAGISAAMNTSGTGDFTVAYAGGVATWSRVGASGTCTVAYTAPTSATVAPTVVVSGSLTTC